MTYRESHYEAAFISMLEESGWQHSPGSSIPRDSKRDALYPDDIEQFLSMTSPELSPADISRIIDTLKHGGNDFPALHKIHSLITDGFTFTPDNGITQTVHLVDFDRPERNIFRALSQLPIEYRDNGQTSTRRPDILLYVNGIPLCIIELKNPASNSDKAIHDAWEQIYYRYWRDIPRLLKYCPLACISDGTNTRLGTVRTPYDHFYAWRKINDGDKISPGGFDQTHSMIEGALKPARFLEILRDYVYFQDSDYDREERVIVCRYPQFFASRILRDNIVRAVTGGSTKGGTYFGAAGCGKTYTMAFLARQLAMRCPEIGSPTIVMIVDREDLQRQCESLFTKSADFLNIGEVKTVQSRKHLTEELSRRESGGFYICTVQKFCDGMGEINGRKNIICFSDEAHRTQIERAKGLTLTKDKRAELSKSYARVLREAFPNAVFAGFTGTPIEATYDTFGEQVDQYTMDLAVSDGLTVPIKYHPRISLVTLDREKAAEIESYYRQCADDGATVEAVVASKRAMSSMEILLGETARLERLADDIHEHYTASADNEPGRVQKAMIACSSRKIAYDLLKVFERKYPEWFAQKDAPFMAMIASNAPNDEREMYEYLGGLRNSERNNELAAMFKDDGSNFRIAIVVDMWITGFDVPSLTFMYNDKPLARHMLIQTISRINRRYPGKEYGLLVDYIGIRDNMRVAVKLYGGEENIARSKDDAEYSAGLFREELLILQKLFTGYDLSPFMNPNIDPAERYELLSDAAEYVFTSPERFRVDGESITFREYFAKAVRRMRVAYEICHPSGILGDEESSLAQCFMAVAGLVRKMNGTADIDTDIMNKGVARMVEEALKYNKVEMVLEAGNDEDIFTPDYMAGLDGVKMPATRLELLVRILRKAITVYGKDNKIAAKKFSDMLEATIRNYQEQRKVLGGEEAGKSRDDETDRLIADITERVMKILADMKIDRESFRVVGLTFEEKAFYDILVYLRDEYKFEYGTDIAETENVKVNEMCKKLARLMKGIIDEPVIYSNWLGNQFVRDRLKFDIKVCLVKNGYPPKYSPEVFRKVMEQVENFKANNSE